jgi:cell division protein FtsB
MKHKAKVDGVGVDGRVMRNRWKSKKGRAIPYPLFLLMVGVCMFCAVGVLAIGISRFSAPFQHQHAQQEQISDLKSNLDALNKSNAGLQHQLDSIKTQSGIETAARDQRFVEPGEVLLNVTTIPSSTPAPAPNPSFSTRIKNAWHSIFGN